MKRDMDLCRAILFEIEKQDGTLAFELTVPGSSSRQVAYQVQLLCDAGLVAIETSKTMPNSRILFQPGGVRLTWAGHDFLDAARSSDRWERAKAIAEQAKGVTFEVFKAILTDLLKDAVGIS